MLWRLDTSAALLRHDDCCPFYSAMSHNSGLRRIRSKKGWSVEVELSVDVGVAFWP